MSSEEIPRIGTATVNCTDPDSLAEFWGKLLDVGIARRIESFFIWLEPQRKGGMSLAFQKVEEPTPGRNRIHLDTRVGDIAGARERIESLGGSFVEDHDMMGFHWCVMADPDGNEFCIVEV